MTCTQGALSIFRAFSSDSSTQTLILSNEITMSKKIMTTRQTGGLNKGYKPTSPASA
ncbi:TPA: hypothetical protein TXT41_001296 [Streptococcus suis]|nr:hypothetical protein [Streptococcus suis]HEL2096357.1 hypothetical protein [Streptococcus suis]